MNTYNPANWLDQAEPNWVAPGFKLPSAIATVIIGRW
jgi:hypothetical protein